jgi:serine/threonine protein kinase
MEFKCPEVKQLENYALNVINQDPLDSSIKTHLGLCLTCRDYVEKWKSHIKSEASAIIPKLENYEIQKLIGIGTHSKVYLAKHLHLNKTYAVKVKEKISKKIKKALLKRPKSFPPLNIPILSA